jgi:hypothetical protein
VGAGTKSVCFSVENFTSFFSSATLRVARGKDGCAKGREKKSPFQALGEARRRMNAAVHSETRSADHTSFLAAPSTLTGGDPGEQLLGAVRGGSGGSLNAEAA